MATTFQCLKSYFLNMSLMWVIGETGEGRALFHTVIQGLRLFLSASLGVPLPSPPGSTDSSPR